MSRFITPECRLSYAQGLFQASAMNEDEEPKYGVTLVFEEGTDITELKRAAVAALKTRFGGQLKKPKEVVLDTQHGPANFIRDGSFSARLPWRNSPEWIEEQGYPKGSTVIRVRSSRKPEIVTTVPDPNNNGNPMPLTDESRVYSGVVGKVSVQLGNPYDVRGNRGVSFYLGNVQVIRDADRFDGSAAATDEFTADPENTANFAAVGADEETTSDEMNDWMEG